jgi:ABC-type transport system involved in Fe-S cluster assembly fused permease/ATPase subunit
MQQLSRSRKAKSFFDKVNFVYKAQSRALFENLDLTIRPGEKIRAGRALLARVKRAFVRLIQRLYERQTPAKSASTARISPGSRRKACAIISHWCRRIPFCSTVRYRRISRTEILTAKMKNIIGRG